MTKNICPECGSDELITDYERAEVICARCGLVLDDDNLDINYRLNECDNLRKRKSEIIEDSTTFTLHDKGLSTMIDENNNDIHGQQISSTYKSQMFKIRKMEWKTKISNSYERNLSKALNEIDEYGSIIGFSKEMKEDSSIIYRKAMDCNLNKGRSIHRNVAACLYITCRRFKVPRTLEEIANQMEVTKKELGRTYRNLCRELNIKLPLISPAQFVPRFASELGLSGEIQAKTIEVIEKAREDGKIQGQPQIIAAGALYIVSDSFGEKIPQEDISKVTGVSELGIRRRGSELQYYLD